MNTTKIKIKMLALSPIVLRIGIGLVIMWFGLQQIANPSGWVVYLPEFTKSLPISQINFVLLNGYFELVFGALLIAGFYLRIVALLLALHMAGIVLSVGYNEIGVRDFGILTALVAIFFHGPSDWSTQEF